METHYPTKAQILIDGNRKADESAKEAASNLRADYFEFPLTSDFDDRIIITLPMAVSCTHRPSSMVIPSTSWTAA